ncbi:MAG TPA: protein-disulfide reductase DsbD domain-containing protein, partial [Acetobacteraceae bacterium]|nr:protein-disulfide reductase DsbD domain-containing protein [Acetobacteraceae bacterium]
MTRLAALLLLLLAAALPAGAGESAAVRSPRATVTLVTDVASVAPGQAFTAGLRLRLAPGWHSYWMNAGDAGAPTEMSFTLPAGGEAGAIAWPAPERIPYGPLVNFGYTGEVLLPVRVTPPASLEPGTPFVIETAATWLVCEQVCIPEEGSFRLELPVAATAEPDLALAPLFAAAAEATPRSAPWTARAALGAGRGSLEVEGAGLSRATVREAFFFPAAANVLDHSAPQAMTVRDGALTLSLTPAPNATQPTTLDGVIAITDGGGRRSAFTIAAPVSAAAPASSLTLARAALFAFLGGVLLNLMPCVFPVLAMKAMALARLSGARRREIRAHAASYTAGVLATFAALGAGLIALRTGGAAIGWGFQFTEPAFVAGMAWL